MVLLRKCLVTHHYSKDLVMSFPVKGSEELRIDFGPEGFVETWGEVDSSVAKGDWESSPKS